MEKKLTKAMPATPHIYRRRFAVLCPECGARVCDISPGSRVEQFTENDEKRPPWEPDVFVKCSACKTELYLYKITE